MRFTHHAKLLALGAALAGLVIVPSFGEVSVADPTGACGFPDSEGVYEIDNASRLAEVGSGGTSGSECRLSDSYRVTEAITLSGAWTPIGTLDAPFTGTFDGGGHDISGLNIQVLPADASNHVSTPDTLGLFGVVQGEGATIENVTLSFVTILLQNNTHAGGYVGALAGINGGAVSNSKVIGTPSEAGHYVRGDGVSMTVGGLIGKSTGPVSDSEATILVQGDEFVGGLIGELQGGSVSGSLSGSLVEGIKSPEFVGGLVGYARDTSISNSSASGLVTGEYDVGGLVGAAVRTTIHDSPATGNVSGEDYVGGLVGSIRGVTITGSSATGDVEGAEDVGGLVGLVYEFDVEPSTVEESFADGDVTGSTDVGGLIGRLEAASTVLESWATGDVSAGDDAEYIGGLVGGMKDNSVIQGSYATGDVTTESRSKWVGGLVGNGFSSGVLDSFAEGNVSTGNDAQFVGGLVGGLDDFSGADTVLRSYASGTVKVDDGAKLVGGLIGQAHTGVRVSESFATGEVTGGNSVENIGGLVGSVEDTSSVRDSYATGNLTVLSGGPVGGLVGQSGGMVRESFSTGKVSGTTDSEGAIGQGNWSGVYFDTQSTGLSGLGGTGKSSAELRQLGTFVGWDISGSTTPTTVWGIHPTRNAGYPFLAWQYDGTNQLTAFCEPAEPSLLNPSVGAGVDNPYLISHPRHLLWFAGVDLPVQQTSFGPRLDDDGDNQTLANRLGGYYRQVASFSLAECDWLPIGRIDTSSDASTPFGPNETLPFTGTYNGDNHQLMGLSVTAGAEGTRVAGFSDEIGLFGFLEGSVSNLTLTGAEVSGENRVGVLAGSIRDGVSLTNISVVESLVKGQRIGGVAGDHVHLSSVGSNDGFTIDGCTIDVELVGVGTSSAEAGGVFGRAQEALQDEFPSVISDCDITVTVRSEFTGSGDFDYIGGVIGQQNRNSDSDAALNGNDRVRVQDTEVTLTVLGDSRLRRVGGIFGYGRGVAEGVATEVVVQNVSSPARALTIESLGGVMADGRDRKGFGTDISTSTATVRTAGLFELEAGRGAGGLVGYGPTVISESSAVVELAFEPARTVGGLVGEWRGGEITNSKASGSIDVSNDTSASAWGGLVGYHGSGEASVIASYTDLTLDAKVSPSSSSVDVGGLVGRVWVPSSPLSVEESYSNTTMTFPEGVGDANAGAFIGRVQSATEIDDSFYDSSRVSPSLQAIGEGAGSVDGVPRALLASQINRIAPFADAGWAIVPATVTSLPSGPTNETWGIVEGGTCGPFLWWEEGKAVSCQAPVTSGSGGSGGSSSNRPSATEPEADGTVLLNPVPRGTNLLQGATENDPVVVPSTPEPSGTDTSDGDTTAEALSGDEGTDISALPASTDSGGMGVLWMLALGGLGLLAAGGATAAVLRARGRML